MVRGWGATLSISILFLSFGPKSEADFKSELERRSLHYFQQHTHPVTGLVRDRARNAGATPGVGAYRMASIAATGFGLAVFANAASRGLVSRQEAQGVALRSLRFAHNHLFRFHGWFYHFVDWETGSRWPGSEVSTIDTALFLAGALYASRVLGVAEISTLAQQLYADLDFAVMLQGKQALSMGWTPEAGFIEWRWDSYAEQLVLLFMGLGHPTRPLPASTWNGWKRNWEFIGSGTRVLGATLPLFVHQYSHLFVDFRSVALEEDFFENSVRATRLNREFCRSEQTSATFRDGFWGLSASGSPSGYRAFSPEFQNGTVCPGCAGASVMFDPGILSDLEQWATGTHGPKLWGQYGFSDSVNLDEDWFDEEVLGITVGPLFLSLANIHGNTSVWREFMKQPWVERAALSAATAVAH